VNEAKRLNISKSKLIDNILIEHLKKEENTND